MSKIFFDHLVEIGDLEVIVRENIDVQEEREEIWNLIDEILHHRVLGCIFDYLPKNNHEEFVDLMHKFPHDESLINYLNEKISTNIEDLIRYEINKAVKEIIEDLSQT